MRPVPGWVSQVVLPVHGESFDELWGPLTATIQGFDSNGYLVLSNYRLIYLDSNGGLTKTFVRFALPLNQIHRVVGEGRKKDGILAVNNLEFIIRADQPRESGALAAHIADTVAKARSRRLTEMLPPPPPPPGHHGLPLPPPPPSFVHEREIIREIIKVHCRYCGGLFEQSASRCPSCGAAVK